MLIQRKFLKIFRIMKNSFNYFYVICLGNVRHAKLTIIFQNHLEKILKMFRTEEVNIFFYRVKSRIRKFTKF